MSDLSFHWFLPTYGDSRSIVGGGHGAPESAARRDRPATLSYLTQIASAAEQMGFEAALTPTGLWCEDAFLTTSALLGTTKRLKFLVAFRPGLATGSRTSSSPGRPTRSGTRRASACAVRSGGRTGIRSSAPPHRPRPCGAGDRSARGLRRTKGRALEDRARVAPRRRSGAARGPWAWTRPLRRRARRAAGGAPAA